MKDSLQIIGRGASTSAGLRGHTGSDLNVFPRRVRESEVEGSAASGAFRFNPDPAAMPRDDGLAQSQAKAAAGRVASVQALERLEDRCPLFLRDSLAIICDRKPSSFFAVFALDLDAWRMAGPVVVNGVGDEILE